MIATVAVRIVVAAITAVATLLVVVVRLALSGLDRIVVVGQ